jgi:hypothetical protein
LLSLDDLNDRVALALYILEMPMIRVLPLSAECAWPPNGTGSAMFWWGCCVPWRMIMARWFSWIVWRYRPNGVYWVILIDHHHSAGTSFNPHDSNTL